MFPDILTLEEASVYLNLPVAQLVEQAATTPFPGRKLGDKWRFDRLGLSLWVLCSVVKLPVAPDQLAADSFVWHKRYGRCVVVKLLWSHNSSLFGVVIRPQDQMGLKILALDYDSDIDCLLESDMEQLFLPGSELTQAIDR